MAVPEQGATMTHSSRAKLRASVTGEPYQLAVEWIAAHGLADGLVPDARLPAQQLAEAAVLFALARPQLLPVLAPTGTLYALTGAEPSSDLLTLRPAKEHTAAVVARLLPAQLGGRISGVPLLRTGRVTNTTIELHLPGASGMEAVQLAIRGTRVHRQQTEQLQVEAGLVPLWAGEGAASGEPAIWQDLGRSLSGSAARWSQALRRPALFSLAHPDWSMSAPTRREVTAPVEAERFAPRSVTPRQSLRGERGALIVAVTVGSGGTGGTTVALGTAAALARQGLTAAVVLEPGALEGPLREHVVETTGDWAVLACPAAGRVEAATRHATRLRQQLHAAQERADVVIVDPTGISASGVRLPVGADVSLVIPLEKTTWGAWLWSEHQTLDHRPDEVRMAAWLSERFESFMRIYMQAQPLSRVEVLLQLLEERFALVAAERNSGTASEYAESGDLYGEILDDAELLHEWWTPHSSAFACDPDETLPLEEEAVLDVWRVEFLQRMEVEGRRRSGPDWEAAAAAWPARSRGRHRLGLHPGALDPELAERVRSGFLRHVAGEATEQWGELWPGYGQVWAEASARGQDLTAGWEKDIEIRRVRRAVDAVAADLASVLAKSHVPSPPAVATVLVRNRVRREDLGSAEQLEAASGHLVQAGITALCEIPSDMTVRERAGAALLSPKPLLAEVFDRLAVLVTTATDHFSARAAERPEGPPGRRDKDGREST
ncbi:hypothetical protein [Streptomyces sp. NPDC051572]|uniref:hypothetical protein n=1 Tax=Streptomyces sp. NPDC051572 TaxID=3155802 RepID=UPI00344D1E96